MTRIVFDPSIPWALWIPLALASVGFWFAYAVSSRRRLAATQRPLILSLMAVAVMIPLFLLLNPTWIRELPPPSGKPLLTLLVDRSLSMATEDVPQHKSRLNAVREAAATIENQLETQFDVEIKTFADNSTLASVEDLKRLQPAGDITDLATAVDESLTDRPQGQIVLLMSDGAHNAAGGTGRLREAAERARTMAVPIYTTTIGGAAGVRDLEISLALPQEMAFVGQTVQVPVTVRQRGQVNDQVQVRLLLNGELVEERQVGLTPDTTTETTFRIQQTETGLFRYEVIVQPQPNEVTDLNNRASLVLRVIDEPVRVLLLEGKPYWDTKFLVRTLALDPSVELHTIVRMTTDRFLVRKISRPERNSVALDNAAANSSSAGSISAVAAEGTSASKGPRDDAWEIVQGEHHWLDDSKFLGQFQIVIFGRDAESFVTDAALIELKKWLRQGDGSLVCYRGPPTSQITSRLGELMPVRWSRQTESRFQVQMTSAGQSLRWFSEAEKEASIAKMPSLARSALPEQPKPLAVVLAAAASSSSSGEQPPVITFQPFGGGRVVVVEGAGMWRWAIRPPSEHESDQLYGELWRSMMRWLVANVSLLPSQRASLRADKTSFAVDESSTATLLVRDAREFGEIPQIWLRSLRTEPILVRTIPSSDDLHQFRADFGKLDEGRYTATLEGARPGEVASSTAFDVVGNLRERLDVGARPDLMRLLAEGSGGAVISGLQVDESKRNIEQQMSASRKQRLQQTVAWDRWWVLASLLFVWGITWTIRRQGGLV